MDIGFIGRKMVEFQPFKLTATKAGVSIPICFKEQITEHYLIFKAESIGRLGVYPAEVALPQR